MIMWSRLCFRLYSRVTLTGTMYNIRPKFLHRKCKFQSFMNSHTVLFLAHFTWTLLWCFFLLKVDFLLMESFVSHRNCRFAQKHRWLANLNALNFPGSNYGGKVPASLIFLMDTWIHLPWYYKIKHKKQRPQWKKASCDEWRSKIWWPVVSVSSYLELGFELKFY